MAIIVSTSRVRGRLPGTASATPVSTRWRRPGQQRHAGAQRRLVLDLGQDPPADRDHRVGGQHQRVGLARRDRLGLLARQPQRMVARQLALGHALVDVGGDDGIGHDADAGEQVEAARARRSEDQPHLMDSRAVPRGRA